MKVRLTTEIRDADKMIFKMYRVGDDGEEQLVAEMTHIRRK